jgi:hypothetical protein
MDRLSCVVNWLPTGYFGTFDMAESHGRQHLGVRPRYTHPGACSRPLLNSSIVEFLTHNTPTVPPLNRVC